MKAVRVLFPVLAIVIALFGCEAMLRLGRFDPNPSPAWRYHPVLGWTMEPANPFPEGVNALGFRFPDVPTRKPEGVGRVLFLGDSFTAATSLPYAETMPGLLEHRLNRAGGRRWEVLSLAVDDWGTAQQLLALQEIGLAYSPDLVILQVFPFNDLCNNSISLAYTCSLQDLHRPYFVLSGQGLRRTDLHPWRGALRRQLRLFGLAERALSTPLGTLPDAWMSGEENQDLRRREFFRHNARNAGLEHEGAVYGLLDPAAQPPAIQESWEVSRRLVREIKRTAERIGAPLLGVTIPFLKTFPEEWAELQQVFPAPILRGQDTRSFERFLSEAGAAVLSGEQLIESSGIPYLDYFISPTDGHLSRFGHSQFNSWILSEVGRLLAANQADRTAGPSSPQVKNWKERS